MALFLKFSKPNCVACDQLAAWLNTNRIDYTEINPFDNPELAGKYKIRTVPTLLVLENENIIYRFIGYNPEELQNILINSKLV